MEINCKNILHYWVLTKRTRILNILVQKITRAFFFLKMVFRCTLTQITPSEHFDAQSLFAHANRKTRKLGPFG